MAPVPAPSTSTIDYISSCVSNLRIRPSFRFFTENFISRHIADKSTVLSSNLYDHKDLLKRVVQPIEQQREKASFSVSARHLINHLRRDNPNLPSGYGSIDPTHISNNAMLWLFALLFVAFIITGIWFFFWAKNGGFKFREGDWDDYKSTVLRRKGPNGTTLSGATKTTKLGQNSSISGESEAAFLPPKHHAPMSRDYDVREYRHEKPARVGGLNRKADGSYYDHANTDRSTVTYDDVIPDTPSPPRPQKKSWFSRATKKATSPRKQGGRVPSAAYSFTQGDDSVMSEETYHQERRQATSSATPPQRSSYAHPPPRFTAPSNPHPGRSSRNTSPTKRGPHSQYTYRDRERESFVDHHGGSEYTYGDSHTDTISDQGTKAYRHVIPGLSSNGRGGGAASQGGSTAAPSYTRRSETRGGARNGAGNGNLTGGFRRTGGRRDSLSDSEGETGTGSMPGSYR